MGNKCQIVMLSVASAAIMMSCGGTSDKHEEEHDEHEEGVILFSKEQAENAGLALETVRTDEFAPSLRVSGQVVEAHGDEMTVVARSSGIISFVRDHLTEGMEVKGGEALAIVSAKGMKGGDDVAKDNLDYETARAAYERASRMIKDTIISRKEYERVKNEYEKAALAHKALGSSAGSSVCAPATGFVRKVFVNPGEYVQAGEKILSLNKNCRLQLVAEAPEKHFLKLKDVQDAVFVMAYETETHRVSKLNGHLVSVGRVASSGSAYIPVTFEFENDGHLVPGAFADVWLLMSPRKNVISVPASSVTEEQGLFFVYVQADHPDEYEKREVSVGGSNGERVEIVKGLKVGDKVVTAGVYQVKLAGASGSVPEAHNHEH